MKKRVPKLSSATTTEALARGVAKEFERIHEHLDQMERRTEGQLRQAFGMLSSLQSQVSGIETDIRRLTRDISDLQKESLSA